MKGGVKVTLGVSNKPRDHLNGMFSFGDKMKLSSKRGRERVNE